MALPDKDHWRLRGDELHPIGPHRRFETIFDLDGVTVSTADFGTIAYVEEDGGSWWICHLGEATWRRIDFGGVPATAPQRVEHVQTVPSAEWVVEHGLDCFPPVVVMDDEGDAMTARVRYPDRYHVVVLFAGARTGRLSIG